MALFPFPGSVAVATRVRAIDLDKGMSGLWEVSVIGELRQAGRDAPVHMHVCTEGVLTRIFAPLTPGWRSLMVLCCRWQLRSDTHDLSSVNPDSRGSSSGVVLRGVVDSESQIPVIPQVSL